jgi:hypothetical protein
MDGLQRTINKVDDHGICFIPNMQHPRTKEVVNVIYKELWKHIYLGFLSQNLEALHSLDV